MLVLTVSWLWTRRWLAIVLLVAAAVLVAVLFRFRVDKALPVREVTQTSVVPTESASPSLSATTAATDGAGSPAKPEIDQAHPLYLLLEAAYKSRDALKDVTDYEAVFSKRELIGRRLMTARMNLKQRHEPFSVYLKFIEPKANAGREVIYVQGLNDDKIVVHEVGFASIAGTQKLLPTSSMAMSGNRYPLTMIGLKMMLDIVIQQWEAEAQFDEVETSSEPDAHLPTGEACIVYEAVHPLPRDHFRFHKTRLWIDKQTDLAIRVEQYGFPQRSDKNPPVIEEYSYSKVSTNVNLDDRDFDVTNEKYGFPR